MAEEKQAETTATTEVKTIPVTETETKTDSATTEATKVTPAKTETVDTKTKPVTETKTETKAKVEETPAEELKSLLDEAGEEKTETKDGETKVIPAKYEFKLPEGMTLDEASMKVVDPIFRELGLDNAQAQKLVDLQNQLTKDAQGKHEQAFNQYVEDLKVEAKTFFGIKLPEVMRNVARARDQFIHKELQEKLNISGLSNDKDVLVFLDKLGRTVGEGKFIEGKQSAPAKGDGKTQIEGVSLEKVYDKSYAQN